MANGQGNILVVGSFVMDLIVRTSRFPQAGETVLGDGFRTMPGGKGANQAIQAARMGSRVTMVGCVGDDAYGEMLLHSARSADVDVRFVQVSAGAPTSIGNVQVESPPDGGVQNRIIVVPGANMSLRAESLRFLEERIAEYDMVLLQMEIPMEVNRQVAAYAAARGVDVYLNPAPAAPLDDALLAHTSYLIPNEHELALLAGVPVEREGGAVDMPAVRAAANRLLSRGVDKVLVTLGDCGSLLVAHGRERYCPILDSGPAVDPTGAGDSFIGAFASARSMGREDGEALRIATAAASLTVTKTGVQGALPAWDEVTRALESAVDCPKTGNPPEEVPG